MSSRVAIVGGARTPFAKAVTVLKDVEAVDLSSHALDGVLSRHELSPAAVEEVHWGVVVVNPRVPHLAREAVFRSQLPATTRAVTLTDNCITGTTAMVSVYDAISAGRIEVGIAGGVESMSNTPILVSPSLAAALRDAQAERSALSRLKHFTRVAVRDLLPTLPGVEEPSTGMSMGEHCELMVKEWGIPREVQDEIALRSHQRAHAAVEDGRLGAEIHALPELDHDTLIRATTSMDKLSRLPPVFDRSPTGTITAGNASALTDGAAAVLLMSESRAQSDGREILAFVKDFEHAAIDPADGL
jgi:acetyl-CoA acetyltransferase family protein